MAAAQSPDQKLDHVLVGFDGHGAGGPVDPFQRENKIGARKPAIKLNLLAA
jgi:hypothetical protein